MTYYYYYGIRGAKSNFEREACREVEVAPDRRDRRRHIQRGATFSGGGKVSWSMLECGEHARVWREWREWRVCSSAQLWRALQAAQLWRLRLSMTSEVSFSGWGGEGVVGGGGALGGGGECDRAWQ